MGEGLEELHTYLQQHVSSFMSDSHSYILNATWGTHERNVHSTYEWHY